MWRSPASSFSRPLAHAGAKDSCPEVRASRSSLLIVSRMSALGTDGPSGWAVMSCTAPRASRPSTTCPRSGNRQETVRSRSRAAGLAASLPTKPVRAVMHSSSVATVRVPPSARDRARPGPAVRSGTLPPPLPGPHCRPGIRSGPGGRVHRLPQRAVVRGCRPVTCEETASPHRGGGGDRDRTRAVPPAPAHARSRGAARGGCGAGSGDLRGRTLRRARRPPRGRPRRGLRGRARAAAARAVDHRPALMVRRSRLDAELVRRGLARSREHAVSLIAEGRVTIGGQAATKPATGGEGGAPGVVRTDPAEPSWVSRGAHKLLGALDAFPAAVEGRRALDAGASTGGFTEVLLQRGAREVVAVDVGYGELAWSLRTDERV